LRPRAWDTSLVSRLVPASPAYDAVLAAAESGAPVGVPTPVLAEVSYGVARSAARLPALIETHAWLGELIASGLLVALPLTAVAAEVAGELRAHARIPPAGSARRGRAKAEQRVGWVMDLMIAATTWVHGYDIVTRNARDYERIAELLPVGDRGIRFAVVAPDFPP
jgi:predicted nucleic acid-binding protein